MTNSAILRRDMFNILNIMRNFFSHETVICDNKDTPLFTNKIGTLIHKHKKNTLYKNCRKKVKTDIEKSI